MIQVLSTKFEKAKLVVPSIFYDFRGEYIETYNQNEYQVLGVPTPFIQDDVSISYKNVLRGIHGDFETWKLIQCLHGSIYAVIVDNNEDSPTYKKWQGFYINDRNRHQLLIPPGFGNSMLALSDLVVYAYKQTTYYSGKQFTLFWNDPELHIFWPIKEPILSQRDTKGPRL